ncbi:MAG: terpene cyclase/mutase family protein, partial [Planctomycetes bacterium]|nr:terpene cyclase/mutase family protein [Planctomycetota bacterium]
MSKATSYSPLSKCGTGAEPAVRAGKTPGSYLVLGTFVATLLAANPLAAQPAVASADRVDLSIRRAADFLWSKQRRDGRWVSKEFEERYPGGLTALSALALRSTGASVSDHRLQLATNALDDRTKMRSIYVRSLTLMLWCALDPDRRSRDIEEDIRFLITQQHSDGAWGYGLRAGRGADRGSKDNSNTQIALLALSQARRAGFDVNAVVWRRAERSWLESQNQDGGWAYPLVDADDTGAARPDSLGSMTAAGIASLRLIHDAIYAEAELPFNGRGAARCGQDHEKTRPIREAIDRAEKWMDEHFEVDDVPGVKTAPPSALIENSWTFYLYCVARAGIASGKKRFGDTRWHRAVSDRLIRRQAANGSWGGVQDTAMGL